MSQFKDLPQRPNDGLAIADVGPWSEDKYRLVELYASLFCRSMRGKWGSLVYLDIFSGPGYARFEGTNRIVAASPIIILNLDDKFARYIFCEANAENAQALAERCTRDFPSHDATVISGDANLNNLSR